MAKIQISVAITGRTATGSSTTAARMASVVRFICSPDAEQPLRAEYENRGHHEVDHHHRSLDPGSRDDSLRDADEKSGGDGAEDVAHAAQGDHHERDAEHVDAHPGGKAANRRGERARDAGEIGAEREGDGEKALDVDTEQGHHLLVLDAGAHDRPVARFLEEQPRGDHQQPRHDHDEEAVLGIEREAEIDAAAQDVRGQLADPDRAPDQDDAFGEDEGEAEGEEQLVVVPRRVKPADPGVLDQQAEQRDPERSKDEGHPEVTDSIDRRDGQVRAHGEQRAVGEVGNVQDPRDQREAEPHQGVQHPRRDPVQDLAEEKIQSSAQKPPMSLHAAYSLGSGVSPVATRSARSSSSFIAFFGLQRRKKYGRSVWWVAGSMRIFPRRSVTSMPSSALMTSGTSTDFALSKPASMSRVIE